MSFGMHQIHVNVPIKIGRKMQQVPRVREIQNKALGILNVACTMNSVERKNGNAFKRSRRNVSKTTTLAPVEN